MMLHKGAGDLFLKLHQVYCYGQLGAVRLGFLFEEDVSIALRGGGGVHGKNLRSFELIACNNRTPICNVCIYSFICQRTNCYLPHSKLNNK